MILRRRIWCDWKVGLGLMRRPPTRPDVAPAPCLTAGHVTFGCFNNFAKVMDPMLALWGRILLELPTSRLCIKGKGFSDPAVRQSSMERFVRLGLPADRVDLLEHTAGAKEHLAPYHSVDVALDTFPYHGTTTTCEALWMGVPVISLVGMAHRSRVGASLLGSVGHPEWATDNEEKYLRAAVALAGDRNGLVESVRPFGIKCIAARCSTT